MLSRREVTLLMCVLRGSRETNLVAQLKTKGQNILPLRYRPSVDWISQLRRHPAWFTGAAQVHVHDASFVLLRRVLLVHTSLLDHGKNQKQRLMKKGRSFLIFALGHRLSISSMDNPVTLPMICRPTSCCFIPFMISLFSSFSSSNKLQALSSAFLTISIISISS